MVFVHLSSLKEHHQNLSNQQMSVMNYRKLFLLSEDVLNKPADALKAQTLFINCKFCFLCTCSLTWITVIRLHVTLMFVNVLPAAPLWLHNRNSL